MPPGYRGPHALRDEASPLTIRVNGRSILRAFPDWRGNEPVLLDADVAIPVQGCIASLLDRTDLIAALQPGGTNLSVFWSGWSVNFQLQLRRLRAGLDLVIETDRQVGCLHRYPPFH